MLGLNHDQIIMDRETYTIIKWNFKEKTVLLWPKHSFRPRHIPMYFLLNVEMTKSLGIKWVIKK